MSLSRDGTTHSTIHNSQEKQATQVFIHCQKEIANAAHILNGILLTHNKGWNLVTCKTTVELGVIRLSVISQAQKGKDHISQKQRMQWWFPEATEKQAQAD